MSYRAIVCSLLIFFALALAVLLLRYFNPSELPKSNEAAVNEAGF